MANWPIKLCTKFGEATVSRFRVIKDFIWAKGYVLHVISYTLSSFHPFTLSPVRTPKVSHRGAPLLKKGGGGPGLREATEYGSIHMIFGILEFR